MKTYATSLGLKESGGKTLCRLADGEWVRVGASMDSVKRLIEDVTQRDPGTNETDNKFLSMLKSSGTLLSGERTPWAGLIVEGDSSLAGAIRTLLGQVAPSRMATKRAPGILTLAVGELGRPQAPSPGPRLPILDTGTCLFYGPFLDGTSQANEADTLMLRLRTTAKFNGAWDDEDTTNIITPLAEADRLIAAANVVSDALRLLDGIPTDCMDKVVRVTPRPFKRTTHLLLPIPGTKTSTPPPTTQSSLPAIVDAVVGIVTDVTSHPTAPDSPAKFVDVRARIANMNRISPWLTDPGTGGQSFESKEHATMAALGEACERYSGEIIPFERVHVATFSEIVKSGRDALDPERLVLFSEEQYKTPGFPFVPFKRDTESGWLDGYNYHTKQPSLLPGSLIYPNWYTGPLQTLPKINNPYYAGIAAGTSLEMAVENALQEIIERHATMTWWCNQGPSTPLDVASETQALWDDVPDSQRAWAIPIPNQFAVPVVAGIVENATDGFAAMGFAARRTWDAATRKAWTEALTMQSHMRDLQNPAGDYWHGVAEGEHNGEFMRPWRQDRLYLDSYSNDFHDIVSLRAALQASLDPRARAAIEHMISPQTAPARPPHEDLPTASSYSEILRSLGYEIYICELTTEDVARLGAHVVRAIVPGTIGNFAPGIPFLGRNALAAAAVHLGWRSDQLSEGEIWRMPMPHA